MAASLMDFEKLKRMRFSQKEVTLLDIIESLKAGSKKYTLKRSTQFTSSFMLWDRIRDEVVICTHAFVILYATPLDTGNFCPDGEAPPMEFKGQMRQAGIDLQVRSSLIVSTPRKMEPSLAAQVSLTFDTRVDPNLHEHLAFLEEWGKTKGDFSTENKSRNPWNSPSAVATQNRFTVSSPLFQKRTGFNVTDDTYVVDYKVHPWVENACVPHNPSWVPNPNLARFMHRRKNDVLVSIDKSTNPKLVPGDLVVMTFRVVFSASGPYWQMSFAPIQAIRTGQISGQVLGKVGDAEDRARFELPKEGEKLKAVTGPSPSEAKTPDNSRPSSPATAKREKKEPKLEPEAERSPSGSEPVSEIEEDASGSSTYDPDRDSPAHDNRRGRRSQSWVSISPVEGSPLTSVRDSPVVSDQEVEGDHPQEYVRVSTRPRSGSRVEGKSGRGRREPSKRAEKAAPKPKGSKPVKRQAAASPERRATRNVKSKKQ